MKQNRLSKWLEGIVVALAVLGVVLFSGLSVYAYQMYLAEPRNPVYGFIFFIWIIAVICYGILYQFWKVCREIGEDNSFSLENVAAFHKMAMGGILMVICYIAHMLWGFSIKLPLIYNLIIGMFLCLAIIFAILCEALSRLVLHAYEVKKENDLTI